MKKEYIILVSPDYLNQIIHESEPFSFYIKGYSNPSEAKNNLFTTNQSSILGYLIVYEELPLDISDIVNFINYINLVGDKSTVVTFCLNSPEGFEEYLRPNIDVNNINFQYFLEFEVMTDSFIKRNLFGSIIRLKKKAYEEEVKYTRVETSNFNSNVPMVLPSNITKVLEPIDILEDFQTTVKYDNVLNSNMDNEMVKFLRTCRIKYRFDEIISFNSMVTNLSIFSEYKEHKILYDTICKMIEEGK